MFKTLCFSFSDVETQNNLQYVFFPVSSSALRFKVKAANDAHIALTNGNYENDPMTEVAKSLILLLFFAWILHVCK